MKPITAIFLLTFLVPSVARAAPPAEVRFTSADALKINANQPQFQSAPRVPFSQPHSNAGWLWRKLPLVDHSHDDCDFAKHTCPPAK